MGQENYTSLELQDMHVRFDIHLFKGDKSGSLTSYLYKGDETLHLQMMSIDVGNLDDN